MEPSTILLSRRDVASHLSIAECISAVEHAFRLYGEGRTLPPKVLGFHTDNGGYHIKTGVLNTDKPYFVAKLNANFPLNPKRFNLPTIQGIIIVCDTTNGRLLALMDSIEITILRTGAATAVAAKHLSLRDSKIATICGCGNKGRISLQALMKVRELERAYAFDIDNRQVEKFENEFSNSIEIVHVKANELPAALQQSQIIVTSTPSKQPFLHARDVMPGTFIAAVGADSEDKQELFPDLVASSKIVVDMAQQSITIGEVHHAIQKGLMSIEDIHAELGGIVAGSKAGRESEYEIIIFDSTGIALQDVATAAIVYEKAIAGGIGARMDFSDMIGKSSMICDH